VNTIERLQRRIRVALGDEPGDLVITGAQVVNVFTCEVYRANVVVADGTIAGVGEFDWEAGTRIDAAGQTILPGLFDAHMHLESTLLMPGELARLVVPHGTAGVIADPHEIGNVLGVPGIDFLVAASEGLPLDLFFLAPSCVPASSWEGAGATLSAAEVADLQRRPRVLGLAEVMDFPALLRGEPGVLRKVLAAQTARGAVDGHAPGLAGRDLVAYAAAGIGSDHESSTVDEARAKARLGLLVQVREGSSARNLDTLRPLAAAGQLGDWCLCTDDVYPTDLGRDGHIDGLLRRMVAGGVAAACAVRHASLVVARHYGLRDRGAVAPGYRADLVAVDDLREFRPRWVLHQGQLVARDGRYLGPPVPPPGGQENTVHLGPLDESAFEWRIESGPRPVIGMVPDQIVTRRETHHVTAIDGRWSFDATRDLLLVTCIERHRGTGRIGRGLVSGFGLRRHGAMGSSVGHDGHNLIVAGSNARDMLACARRLAETGGGLVVARDGAVVAELPLPVAGLLSASPYETVCSQLDGLHQAALALGCPLAAPFGTLSFLALTVIPELRITDRGLFDVCRQQLVN
jgi:adenine deaminase